MHPHGIDSIPHAYVEVVITSSASTANNLVVVLALTVLESKVWVL